jgi:protease IV
VTEEMVNDSFRWFLNLVEERRQLSPAQIQLISDGRVFTGRQAVAEQLVDQIGGEERRRTGSPPTAISTRIWRSSTGRWGQPRQIAASALPWPCRAERAGLRRGSWLIEKISAQERLRVDGLVSVWHPGQ